MPKTQPPNYLDGQRSPVNQAYVDLEKVRVKMMLASWPKDCAWKVLDIGCRGGTALQEIKRLRPGVYTTGIDILPEGLKGVPEEGFVMDAHQLDFRDDTFDWVFSSNTLEHCYDVPQAVSEIFRVATRGVFIVVPLEGEDKFQESAGHYYHTKDPLEWLKFFQHPEWLFTAGTITAISDFVFTFTHQSLVQYGGDL